MFEIVLCVATQHNGWLVTLAAAICLLATFATFFLYAKVPPYPVRRRLIWLAMIGLVAGSGIWTTHFVAMLAFRTGLPTGYAHLETLASLGAAVISTAVGFGVASSAASRPSSSRRSTIIAGGLIVGLGVTLMHYVGMSGYRTAGVLRWDLGYVAASVLIGAAFSTAALLVAPPGSKPARQALGAGLLSLGIVGMHFTGMTAVAILPDAAITVPASLMSSSVMSLAAVAGTLLIIVTAILAVAFDTASRGGNLRRMREALDVMPEGLGFYDANDRLIAWNTRYEELCRTADTPLFPGLPFEELLRSTFRHGVYPDSVGREDEWLAERMALRRTNAPGTAKQVHGRWLQITDRRTADGGVVTVCVDVTDLTNAKQAMAEARDRAEALAARAEAADAVAGLGHWRVDGRTREVVWSSQLYKIYGLDPNAPLDLDAVMAMTHPDDNREATDRLERQLATGESDENSISKIVQTGGEVRYLLSNSRGERGDNGEVIGVIGTVVDVTDRVRNDLAREEAQAERDAQIELFETAFRNAAIGKALVSLDGRFLKINPAFCAIVGYPEQGMLSLDFQAITHPEDLAADLDLLTQLKAGEISSYGMDKRYIRADGEIVWVNLSVSMVVGADGEPSYFIAQVQDLTARKALEAELRQARAEAEAAAAVKGEFLANMSHELRTPLTSIIGLTGLTAEQTDLSDVSRGYIERVTDASRALLCIVNDVLDFSKLEAGQVVIAPQPVALTKLGRATLDLFTPQAGAKDLTLTMECDAADEDLVVAIDPDRIRQILLNFVSNAVKFTKAGGVTLRTGYDRAGGMLNVDVIDTGGGIPPEKLERLFKRFSQIDGSLTRAQGGTGLGLAICKGLVEAMGGEIGVESHEGQGSRFWFKIPAPIATLARDDPADATGERAALTGLRVLVADDHATNRELARLFLAAIGAEVTEAADGEEAVSLAAQWPFDVILMDMRMPRLDGLSALRRIRATAGPNDATPILAFTADAGPEIAAEFAAQGFQARVAKPLEPGALIAAIAQALAPSPSNAMSEPCADAA